MTSSKQKKVILLPVLGFQSGDIDGVYLIYACSEVYNYVRVKHRLQDISVYQSLSVKQPYLVTSPR